MSAKTPYLAYLIAVLVLVAGVQIVGAETTKGAPDTASVPARIAEVTGQNVYVRSGDSTNHYPVGKLNAGDRVTIVGESGEWFEILPPEGSFSLISGQYVDSMDNKKGIVNGDNVRVRAGSSVAEFAKLKYVVQLKLSKGAEVTILEENPDGFLKIKPPIGVTLWTNSRFVHVVPSELLQIENETAASAVKAGDTSGARTTMASTATGDSGDGGTGSVATASASELAAMLEAIDTAARAEMEKPLLERGFASVIVRYRAIVAQEENEFARQYAANRIERIEHLEKLIASVRRVHELTEKADAARREHLAQRARIRVVKPTVPGGFDAQGELRPSAAFASKTGPVRYRLVDTSTRTPRTVGYVEIPPNSDLSVKDFLGRYVGVRASEKRMLSNGVDPIPIYVAVELVILEQEAGQDD